MQVRQLGMVPYHETLDAMRALTASRDSNSEDILWLCEHPSVYTLGVAALPAHILDAGITPVVTTDRGGQVTYHGPGQAVAYPLIDLRKRNYFIKEYVFRLEESVIRTLCDYAITGHRIVGAPGIYVSLDSPHSHRRLRNDRSSPPSSIQFRGLGKISALGIKVSKHCTYHGASLNVAMDLEPFSRINPCGYAGLKTIDLSTISGPISLPDVMQCWESHLQQLLG